MRKCQEAVLLVEYWLKKSVSDLSSDSFTAEAELKTQHLKASLLMAQIPQTQNMKHLNSSSWDFTGKR